MQQIYLKNFARQEEEDDNQQDTVKQLIQLVQKDKTVSQFIDLLYKIKHNKNTEKQTKNICSLNQKDRSDADPLVNLEIEGYHVQQVIFDFRSQVNIMTRDTWEQLGKPRLKESGIYLNLAYQGLIEPIVVCRNVDTTIKSITTKVEFKIINPKEGSISFPALVG